MKTVFFATKHRDIYADIMDSVNIEYCSCDYNYRKGINGLLLSKKIINYTPKWALREILYYIFGWNFLKAISSKDEVLFVVSTSFALYEDYIFICFIRSLKRLFFHAKFALHYIDVFGRRGDSERKMLDELKKEFNFIVTFDKRDSEDYGFDFYDRGICSKLKDSDLCDTESSDVFYCGSNAGRFEQQLHIFKKLSDYNLKCIFYIVGVSIAEQEKISQYLARSFSKNGVWEYNRSTLIINKSLPYQTLISHEVNSVCNVDILIGNQTGSTMRMAESVVYHTKIITNNHNARQYPFYDPNNIMIFDNIDSLNEKQVLKFLSLPVKELDYDCSPLRLVDYIKNKLY